MILTRTGVQTRRLVVPILLFLVHLTIHASCLATPTSVGNNANGASAVIVSTQKNGGKKELFPSSKPNSSSFHKGSSSRSLGRVIREGSQNVQSAIRSTFMPSGYPDKTPPGYLRFSVWSWIQDWSTSLRSVLATQRILEGVGVGREGATALSALMNFLARDGCGMIATLLFTSAASSRFRSDVKRWRLVADLAVDLGITLEVAAVSLPSSLFLPVICLGNMCKAICGVAAGACGGSINLHWASGSDISDINAKFGAQHTVTGGLGLILAAVFARSVSEWKLSRLWILYSGLTLLHIVANMRCMRLLSFKSLNHVRMNIVLSDFLAWWDQQTSSQSSSSTSSASPMISKPVEVTTMEPLFFLPSWLLPKKCLTRKTAVPIFFGESFNDFCSRSKAASGAYVADTLLGSPTEEVFDTTLGKNGYAISAGVLPSSPSKTRLCVDVVFRSNTSPEDEAKAYLHAILLGRALKKLEDGGSGTSEDMAEQVMATEAEISDVADTAWTLFRAGCELAGWDLTRTEIQTLGFEIAIAAATQDLELK